MVTSLFGRVAGVRACHEYIGNREYWLLSWYLEGVDYATPYLERTRKKLEEEGGSGYFIDINGYLQNSVSELQSVFRPEQIFHLVRDPREVVRSIYCRRSERDIHLLPKNRVEIERWFDMDKFSQICWNWADTTRRLIDQGTKLVQLEKLITDYAYFKGNLLAPFGMELDRNIWSEAVNRKTNRTRSRVYRYLYARLRGKDYVRESIPHYRQWSHAMQDAFSEICGDAMKSAGYLE
jgi:hypothetical protein